MLWALANWDITMMPVWNREVDPSVWALCTLRCSSQSCGVPPQSMICCCISVGLVWWYLAGALFTNISFLCFFQGIFWRSQIYIDQPQFLKFNISVQRDALVGVYGRKGLPPSHTQVQPALIRRIQSVGWQVRVQSDTFKRNVCSMFNFCVV